MSSTPPAPSYRKKLIEVALPLEAINIASAREKSIRHGHPSTLHLWWARRPLAAARAVIFSSLVDDPDSPDALPAFVEACRALPKGPNATVNDTPRMRLFDFIELLVQWESTTSEMVLNQARELINIATEGNPPPLLDPFAGGGSIPLEAQRLGLEAHASDLNPVAVMINKAQIEIPPRFANMPPVNPRDRERISNTEGWKGAAGLAADVRYYGEWMRDKAWERIGHLYPTLNGETVIAWIWARTVKSPNPAVDVQVPLVRSFELSKKKKGKRVWIEPIIDPQTKQVSFEVRREQNGYDPKTLQDGTVNRRGGHCIVTGVPMPFEYIRAEAKAGRMGAVMMAIVTEGKGGRNFYTPTKDHIQCAKIAIPDNVPITDLPEKALSFRVQAYGIDQHYKLFTPRQLVALTTFSDLVAEAREQAYRDAFNAGVPDNNLPLRDGGQEARAYVEAISVYLAFAVDKSTNRSSSIVTWKLSVECPGDTFGRQAIPMAWDYAESNILTGPSGSFSSMLENTAIGLEKADISLIDTKKGYVLQADAAKLEQTPTPFIVSTDPPYYNNIGYADLSDYFYIWLRPILKDIFPQIFGTMLVPKEPELIASPYRFDGDQNAATEHFEHGLQKTFVNIWHQSTSDYPLTVYYAFKQLDNTDDDDDDDEIEQVSSTGWETILISLVSAGFSIDGTWPMRTERGNRTIAMGTNSLASSIILVCRKRSEDASTISRNRFVDLLRKELPAALKEMQSGNIAPVDLAQASIGPGMAIYSRYKAVLEPDGKPLSIRTALGLINQELDTYLSEQDGNIDGDTRFAISWFEQFGFTEGEFGLADVLARAKNTSVHGVEEAGVVQSGRGKVKLVHWKDYDPGVYNPQDDKRATIWEATHHLIERLSSHGEEGAALLMNKMNPEVTGEARNLAYRLYSICERKGWADHARDYNTLVIQWPSIAEQAAQILRDINNNQSTQQTRLFDV